MQMNDAPRSLHLGGEAWTDDLGHVCAFFRSAEEKYRTLMPFIKEGLEQGEKAVHFVAPQLRLDLLRRIHECGVDTSVAERSGQLHVLGWKDVQFRDGAFDQESMLSLLAQFMGSGEEFPGTRLVGYMEWIQEDAKALHGHLEFEARVNLIVPKRAQVICAYELDKCRGDIVLNALRTHPIVLLAGLVQHNPFYVPPEELLRELAPHRTSSTDSPAS
jgi:hypothetical protein